MAPSMTAKKELASNDILRIHVENCTGIGLNCTKALEFRRIEIPIDFIGTRQWDGKTHEPRKAVPISPSSEYNIKFRLGDKLSAGSSGLIYEVSDPTLVDEGEPAGVVAIPPLVVKIAARTKKKNLAREAWFYDEMQTLQGVVIPRCYGWFEAQLAEGVTFVPSENDDIKRSYPKDDPIGERFFSYWKRGAFNEDSRPLLNRLGDDRSVSFILLERLGNPFLPVGVLSVLPPPGGQPSIPSSYNGRVFKCRLIDFELSRKFMQDPELVLDSMMSWATVMLDNLPYNYFHEQSFP